MGTQSQLFSFQDPPPPKKSGTSIVYWENAAFELEKLRWLKQNRLYMETSNPLLKRDEAFSGAWDRAEPMTLQGVINKTGILLLLCLGSAAYA
jgi:hypothetical protein